MLTTVTVVGSGSWATALVKLLSENGVQVKWLVRNQEFLEFVTTNHHTPRHLSHVRLTTERIYITTDPGEAIDKSELILFAVPSIYLESSVNNFDIGQLKQKQVAVSIKGFIPSTGCTPSRYMAGRLDQHASDVIVLGGPCHAEEIGSGKTTYMTVASPNVKMASPLAATFANDYIHTVINQDPLGIEYAAILKNIIGVASGLAAGLHYGDNFSAVLISNAMREAGRLIEQVYPVERDLFQSAYFGDLLVTAYSGHSRNRTLGQLLGKGYTISQALMNMKMTAEGYHASRELAPILKTINLDLPILNMVHRILHRHANPLHEFRLLEGQLN